jgi:hypothetical protein
VYGLSPEVAWANDSPVTCTSPPNAMPTALFAANPVAVTLTELPELPWDDDKVIVGVAALAKGETKDTAAKTIENVRKIIIVVVNAFFARFIFYLLSRVVYLFHVRKII